MGELNKGIESYISLPAGVNLLNFKLRLIDLTEFTVWHGWGLGQWVAKISD